MTINRRRESRGPNAWRLKCARTRWRSLELLAARATVSPSGEAREGQWSEFDFGTATWVIPGTRMKTGFPHRVPLSDRVLEILREMRELNSGTGLVFPGMKRGRPFRNLSTTLRHQRLRFTEQSLLLWMWQVG